ncbi:MAG: Uma2 family endonuclease, partial [Bacteroidia bacterium]
MLTSDAIIISKGAFRMTEEEFYIFCHENRDLRIERDANQNIIIMSPTKRKTGRFNAAIIAQLYNWSEKFENGYVYDSSTAFRLNNNAVRSPDAAWIAKENLRKDESDDTKEFEEGAPDFVIELKSKSDTVKGLQLKMEEYIANGVKLGYLIIPELEKVYIYEPGKE